MVTNRIRTTAGWVLTVVLAPAVAWAQAPASSATFEGMSVKPGQVLLIEDTTGRTTRGKVISVSDTSLVVSRQQLVRSASGTESQEWSGTQTFRPDGVSKIRRPGPIWDGAIKGFVVGFLIPLPFQASCSDCTMYLEPNMIAGLIGAGIGLGIDALVGPKTIFRADHRRGTWSFSPLVSKDRRGAMVVVQF